MGATQLILGNWNRNFVASPASLSLFLRRGYLWLCLLTHYRCQTTKSFHFRYGSSHLLPFYPPLTFVLSSPSSHQTSCPHATGMQMPLAPVMERSEPSSEYGAGGMGTHPAAGSLVSVGSFSSLLFLLCWRPSRCVTVLPGCGNTGARGGRRERPKQRLVWEKFLQVIHFNSYN